jgi:hypothetical protein
MACWVYSSSYKCYSKFAQCTQSAIHVQLRRGAISEAIKITVNNQKESLQFWTAASCIAFYVQTNTVIVNREVLHVNEHSNQLLMVHKKITF